MTKPLISVCICTFRRSSVCETIASIVAQQTIDALSFEIVVADNDLEPSAREYIETMQSQYPEVEIKYVHAPSRNISIARNACLETARGDWIAFIDDDEVASETWLQTHYNTATKGDLDVCIGPVLAMYPESTPAWIKSNNYHTVGISNRHPVTTGHAGNSFFQRTHPAIQDLRFSEARGRTGGEDTQFFHECYLAGAKLGEAPDAVAYEPVRENRLSLNWLVKNKFRSGITYGKVIYYKGSVFTRFGQACLAASKASYFLLLSGLTLGSKAVSRGHYVRAIFHAGVAGAFVSAREAEYYGVLTPTEPNPSVPVQGSTTVLKTETQ